MTVPELPGFYYDEEKKKYFKIEANHVAPRAYTHDRVKKAKLSAAAEAEKHHHDEQQRTLLKRRRFSAATSHTSHRLRILHSELGNHSTTRESQSSQQAQTQIWADTLKASQDFTASRDRNISSFEIMPSKGGILTVGEKQFLRWYPAPYHCFYESKRTTTKMPATVHRMTSSALDHTGERVLVTSANAYCLVDVQKNSHPVVRGEQMPAQAATMWCCTFSPNGKFAAGGSSKQSRRGVLAISMDVEGESQVHLMPKSDVFALEYLENDVLLSGSRDGVVRLWDVREHLSGGNGGGGDGSMSKGLVKHMSTITHMRKLRNGYHLLVNGLENNVSMYDLRFCTSAMSPTTTTSSPHRRYNDKNGNDNHYAKARRNSQHQYIPQTTTTPVMTYTTTNASSTTLGFDLSASQEVFAVAGEDASVSLYETYSGRMLRRLSIGGESHTVRFSKNEVDAGGSGDELYVATGSCLQRWRMEDARDVEMEDAVW